MKRKGFTLIEVMVVIIIIGILASMATAFFKGDNPAQKKCAENLRVISNAIEAYRDDPANNGQYPPDGTINPAQDLKTALTSVPAENFVCPSDTAGSTDSYSVFYVKRNDNSKMTAFSLGCPRHDGGKSAINAFFQGQVMKREIAETQTGVKPGESASAVTLADNSTVSVSGGAVTFLQSFKIGNSKCYSLFKTDAAPKDITLSVTPGSKLEVITPAAIAGVEGTKFTVSVIDAETTTATVNEGKVTLEEKNGHGKIDVPAGHKGTVKKDGLPTISVIDAETTTVTVNEGEVTLEEKNGHGKIDVLAGHKGTVKKNELPTIKDKDEDE